MKGTECCFEERAFRGRRHRLKALDTFALRLSSLCLHGHRCDGWSWTSYLKARRGDERHILRIVKGRKGTRGMENIKESQHHL